MTPIPATPARPADQTGLKAIIRLDADGTVAAWSSGARSILRVAGASSASGSANSDGAESAGDAPEASLASLFRSAGLQGPPVAELLGRARGDGHAWETYYASAPGGGAGETAAGAGASGEAPGARYGVGVDVVAVAPPRGGSDRESDEAGNAEAGTGETRNAEANAPSGFTVLLTPVLGAGFQPEAGSSPPGRDVRRTGDGRGSDGTGDDSVEVVIRGAARIAEADESSRTLDDDRFQAIAESLDAVLYLEDPAERRMLYVSPGCTALWQRSRERLQEDSRAFLDAVHPRDRARVKQARSRQVDGSRADVRYRLLGRDGSIRWLRDRSVPVRDASGDVQLVAGMVQDVTGERRTRQQMQRRAALEGLVARVALELSQADAEALDDEIQRALRRVGEFLGADNGFVYHARQSGDPLRRTHAWIRGAPAPGEESAVSISSEEFSYLTARLESGDPLVVRSPGDLPPGAEAERRLLDRLGVEAFVAVPMVRDGGLTGFVAIDLTGVDRLALETIDMLRILSELVRGALDRRVQTDALRSSRERYRRLVESGQDIVFEIDESGTFAYVSPSVLQATGYHPEEVVGQAVTDFLPPTDAEDVEELIAPFTDVDVTDVTFRFNDRSGEPRYFRVSAQARGESGKTPRIYGIATDVTARKTAELALRSEQAFTRNVLDSLSGVFYVVGPTMRVQRWNETLETTFGLAPDEVENCRFSSLFPFGVRPEVNDYLTRAFLGTPTQFEARIQTADDVVPYAFTASPVDVDGERFVAGMGIDISERVSAQRALAESFEVLRQMHSVSVDEDLVTDRKIDRLLGSAQEYLGARCSVFYRIEDAVCHVRNAVGDEAPDAGATIPIDATFCQQLLDRPPYEWPVVLPSAGSSSTTPAAAAPHVATPFVGIPVVVDGEAYGALAFYGATGAARHKVAGEQREYVKLLAQWIASTVGRESANREIEQSERRFRELFEAAPDAYFVIDPESGRILDCNETACDLVGDDARNLIGRVMGRLRCFRDLYENGDAGPAEASWVKKAARKGYARVSDVTLTRHEEDGGDLVVDVSASRVDLDGQPSVLAVLRDTTRRKIAENELRAAVRQNAEFNEELQTLIDVSTRLESRLDLDVMARRIAAGAVDTLRGAEAASVWTFEDGAARLVAADGHGEGLVPRPEGAPEEGFDVTLDATLNATLEVAGGVLGRITDGAEDVQVVSHVLYDRATAAELDAEPLLGLRSLIAIPLRVDGASRGVLLAENYSRDNAFGPRDLALSRSLGAQANVALSNAHFVRELRATSHRLLQAQEDERRRLAQELHDETGGLLTSLQFKLREVETQMDGGPLDEPPPALDEARDLAVMLSDLLRRVSRSLRPRLLDDLGLHAALAWLTKEFGEQSGLSIQLASEIAPGERFPNLVETTVFRIVQEALTNVARYADTDGAEVVVNRLDDALQVHVIDDGAGFDVDATLGTTTTLGLRGMIERADRLDGSVDVVSEPGEGCRVTAHIPAHPSSD